MEYDKENEREERNLRRRERKEEGCKGRLKECKKENGMKMKERRIRENYVVENEKI